MMDYHQICLARAINGIQCSGHGECVEDIGCVCHQGWTGSSDVLDYDRIDCQLSKIADTVLWALVILLFLMLWKDFFHSINVVKENFKILSQRQRNSKGIILSPWTYKPFLALFPGAFIICPMYIIIATMRIASNRVVGTDVTITALTTVSTITMFITNFFLQSHIVQSLAVHMSPDSRWKTLVSRHDKLYLFATVFVILFTVLPQIAVLYFPKFDGDALQSPALIVLLFKNIGTILYIMLLGLSSYVVDYQIAEFTSQTSAPFHSKASQILDNLSESTRNNKKKVIVATIVYIVFSTPPLWGMQNFIYALIYIIYSLGEATPARYFLHIMSNSANPLQTPRSEKFDERSLGSAMVIVAPATDMPKPGDDFSNDKEIQTFDPRSRTELEFTVNSAGYATDFRVNRVSSKFSEIANSYN